MSANVYDEFAHFYNLYWGESFTADAQEGLSNFVLPFLQPKARILDLCCGAGHIAAWLGACGFDVTGLDVSEPMIELARENAPGAEFVLGDATAFSFPEPFDAVVCVFDSVNHLRSADEVRAVFKNVSRALRPGGLFVFDINTDRGFRFAAGETWAAVRPDHVCLSKSQYEPGPGEAVSQLTLFRDDAGSWIRTDLEIHEYLYPPEQIVAALLEAGFDEPNVFDAEEDFGMPRAEGRLFYLARRT